MINYTPTIGIEIHVQLNTKSKMFCGCDNESRTSEPNTNICPICLGYPGTLPSINRGAIEKAIRLGLGLNGKISKDTKFDRKNYFYPDLSKGYQITQFDQPIMTEGFVELKLGDESRKVGIERAHIEEDAAKLIHPPNATYSLVDYNRGGTPLVEIVSKPDMHSPAEARIYLQTVYNIATALGVTNGNMEAGNFKFDLNISLSNTSQLGNKVELKNLNSFRYAEKALAYEIVRQTKLLDAGQTIDQETRGYDDVKSVTFSQRIKEEAHDYRYFPEPDLPPLIIDNAMIEQIKASIMDIDLITAVQTPRQKFITALVKSQNDDKIARIIDMMLTNDVTLITTIDNLDLNNDYDELVRASSKNLANLAHRIADGQMSKKQARVIAPKLISLEDKTAEIDSQSQEEISDEAELDVIIQRVVAHNPQAKSDYMSGKENALRFLMGQVMKETKGQADPTKVAALLQQHLK